jgi:Uma2 family endonuclease
MIEADVLVEDDRVELLEGWIVPQMVHSPQHDATIELIDDVLRSKLPAGWRLRIQSATTTSDSEPEPDLAVVRGSARERLTKHPGPSDVTFVIEVAQTSLNRDRTLKKAIYAKAAIPIYWIVNLIDRQIEVFSDPKVSRGIATFSKSKRYRSGETVPLVVAGKEMGRIAVGDLLP